MTQAEFIERYNKDIALYNAWGNFVTEQIKEGLKEVVGGNEKLNYFLRIPPSPRTKSVDSLVAKAYYRGKHYTHPYEEITDKVGTRFVVLLLQDIKCIETVIKGQDCWIASKDRDFEEERLSRPTLFDYQSVHYVVRCVDGISNGNDLFPKDLPCEIQIRTLMQHAFSELTHDTIYKPTVTASPQALRNVAKSMALIETTDKLFEDVSMSLEQASSQSDQWIKGLESLYRETISQDPGTNHRANSFLLSALNNLLKDERIESVRDFVQSNPISQWVNMRLTESFLFRQPAILLVYYLADKFRIDLKNQWPFTIDELAAVYTDLGHSIGET